METVRVVVVLLVALSVASERLVEIIKGLTPWLDKEIVDDVTKEGYRRAALQLLAVASGILTAYFAKGVIASYNVFQDKSAWVALGLLASGGSGFWNAILTYVTKLKEIKSVEASVTKIAAPAPGNPGGNIGGNATLKQ